MSISFQVDGVRIGSGNLFLIAGPCVIESEKHALFMAEVIKGVTRSLNVPFIFKASYDKANRTSMRSFRGPGLTEGLRILKKVKDEVHVPVLTDVHETADVAKVAEVADVLQIPAFLCRQTDLIVAAAMTERAVNIKKGQFVSPWDMKHAWKNAAPPETIGYFSPNADRALATTIWWWTCGRSPSCGSSRRWFLTRLIRCSCRPPPETKMERRQRRPA